MAPPEFRKKKLDSVPAAFSKKFRIALIPSPGMSCSTQADDHVVLCVSNMGSSGAQNSIASGSVTPSIKTFMGDPILVKGAIKSSSSVLGPRNIPWEWRRPFVLENTSNMVPNLSSTDGDHFCHASII